MTLKTKTSLKTLKNIGQYFLFFSFIAVLFLCVIRLYPQIRHREETAQVQKKKEILQKYFRAVLPLFDNEPWKETVQQGGRLFYIARNNQAPARTYQITPSLLNTPDLQTKPKQTHIVGFAFVMTAQDSRASFLLGADFDGNILSADVSKARLSAAESRVLGEELRVQAKELIAGHRDLLMFQLEPEESVTHA